MEHTSFQWVERDERVILDTPLCPDRHNILSETTHLSAERSTPSPNRPDLTVTAITRFLKAIGVDVGSQVDWEWGPYAAWDPINGCTPTWVFWGRRHGTADDLIQDVVRLRSLQRLGCSVFLRAPANVIYIDDMTPAAAVALRGRGVVPRAVVETSTGRTQIWLRVPPGVNARELYVGIEHELYADRGARPSAEGKVPRLGRLPGFINTKPGRGKPWVLLRSSTSRPEPESSIQVIRDFAAISATTTEIRTTPPAPAGGAARPPQRRRSTPAAGNPDAARELTESERDWAAACRAASRVGASMENVIAAIIQRRPDVWTQKHDPLDYLDRTAREALKRVGRRA